VGILVRQKVKGEEALLTNSRYRIVVKVKQSRYRPGGAQRVPGS